MAKKPIIKKDGTTWSRLTFDFSPRTYTMLEEIMHEYGMANKAEVVRLLIHEKHESLTAKQATNNETKGANDA